MEKKIKPTVTPPTEQPQKVKVPWWFDWEIKDLVHPITIKRVHVLLAGLLLVLLAGTGYFVYDKYFRGPTGAELLGDMVEAAGGMEAWNELRHGQFTRTHNLYNESGNLLETTVQTFFFKKTNEGLKLQVKSTTHDGELVWVGKDKDGYWASQDRKAVDPVLTARGQGMMCDSKFCEPLCASSMAFYRFSMPFKLTDRGVIPHVSEEAFAISDFNPLALIAQVPLVLDITYDPEVGKDRWRFFVDPNDKLIRKIEYYNKSDAGDSRPEEIYWTDHRMVAGITFSHHWSRFWGNGKVMDEYLFSDVDFETELADRFFERPEGHEWLTIN